MKHPIPDAALAQHIAILGKTGSGKTYAAKGVVENLLRDGARVCVIDPTGAWHGLRSSATGKSAGFPVVIFGGENADLPLGAAHGEALAEIIGTSSTPAIIDTSLMRVGERTRFFSDFADALVRKNKGPLHLVIDEAHLFAPQGKVSDPQSGAMLHAANNLVSLGRSRGLRIILITQRPAKLHKDSLTQVETLVALRLIAPQDRKAVEEWIKDNADEKKGREIITSLAQLPTGQGWVWAPEIDVLERVIFPKIKTFDTSRAPEHGDRGTGPVLAPIDHTAIEKRLQAVAADALANDPKALKAENAKLKRELALKPIGTITDPQARESVRLAGFELGLADGLNRGENRAKAALQAVESRLKDAFAVTGAAMESLNSPMSVALPRRQAAVSVTRAARSVDLPGKSNGQDLSLPKGERLCLAAMAQHCNGITRQHITVITGYKRSTRDAYIQRLREKDFCNENSGRLHPTDTGLSALGEFELLPTGEELQQHVLSTLPEGERAVLATILPAYPEGVDRDKISDETGYKRSTRDAYIQRLSTRELVDIDHGVVTASENLFS